MGASNKWLRTAAVIGAMALVATACGDGDDGGGGDGTGAQTISLLHAIGADEQPALEAAIDAFEESSGHTVQVEYTDDIAGTLTTRIDGNNPPDVALHPQPGALAGFADQGALTPLADVGATEFDNMVPGMIETGTFGGTHYGVPVKAAVSSLLWYRTDMVDSPPATWEDLIALSDSIAADEGITPWCIGIESGGATGWVATNWIEDIVLRTQGGEGYDAWTSGELDFASPEITAAFEMAEEIWFNEDYVLGGTSGILNTPFADAAAPMWQEPPACALHRQAGFIASGFTGEFGTDYGVTIMPTIDGNGGAVFSGDVAVVLSDSTAAGELVQYLASSEGQTTWHSHEASGSLSTRSDFDNSAYPSESLAQQGELLATADTARFDGSDLMPSAVGGNAFFTELVAWLNGSQDLETTLTNIDAAWPAE